MLKKIITVAAAGLVSFAMLSSQASTTVVIGDFEGAGTGQLDGWSVTGANSVFAGDDIGAIWSSTGNGAMAIIANSDNAFQWQIQYTDIDVISQLASSGIAGGARIEADVYWLTSDWNGTGWARWDTMSMNSNQGWLQLNDSNMTDVQNPSSPGGWDTTSWGASNQRTISWDWGSTLAAIGPQDIKDGGWTQLNMSVNLDTGAGTSGIFYIDNIRAVIPEPGTMALLGMGGLLMVIRRRRA